MREAENKKRQLEEAADALREECARLQVSHQSEQWQPQAAPAGGGWRPVCAGGRARAAGGGGAARGLAGAQRAGGAARAAPHGARHAAVGAARRAGRAAAPPPGAQGVRTVYQSVLHASPRPAAANVFCVYSTYQELTLARQQLQDDYEKLKREEADKSAKLKELMLVSRSPRRNLDKAEKEVVNQQMVLKDESEHFRDYIISPKREKLGFGYGMGLDIEKASAKEEKSLSAIPKSPSPRHSCNIHPLQLHLLISVTMILLTHRYPQIVVLV